MVDSRSLGLPVRLVVMRGLRKWYGAVQDGKVVRKANSII